MKKIIPVFPWPPPARLMKELGGIPNIQPIEALPGGPGPILAIREPNFVCDAIMVKDPEYVKDAVRIIAADGIEFVSMRDQIGHIVGGEVVEMQIPIVSKVRFQ